MELISRNSALWQYMPLEIKGLIEDGERLLAHAEEHASKTSDYSYLVFPFAKAYEGFLKRLFLDLELIREDEYYGDDIRIGRMLNPSFVKEHGNVFDKVCSRAGNGHETAELLWDTWKIGRNQVFHYFPHNFRKLTQKEAVEVINKIISAMAHAVGTCKL